MSITDTGASYPSAPWPVPPTGITNTAGGNAAGGSGGTSNDASNANTVPLPPVQAATAPGTGLKIDIIA
jgi:hypothetical protein